MKNSFILFLVFFFTLMQRLNAVEIDLVIDNYQGEEVKLETYLHDTSIIMASNGRGYLSMELEVPMFANIVIGKNKQRIYLEPEGSLSICCEEVPKRIGDIVYYFFKCTGIAGSLAQENQFISGRPNYSFVPPDKLICDDVEQSFMLYQQVIHDNVKMLENMDFSDDFKKLERERIKYLAYNSFVGKCFRFPDFTEILSKIIKEDGLLLYIDEYRTFIKDVVKLLAVQRVEQRENFLALAREEMKIINAYFKTPQILAFLYDTYVLSYIAYNGCKGAEDLIQTYLEKVTDNNSLKRFNNICAVYAELSLGKRCPDFSFKDISGEYVSLSDLQGKFVYIDLWATWCGPCRGEFPALKLLEDKLKGKDIFFVGISIDKNDDIDSWKKMVQTEKLGGIQLHLGENWNWLKNFMPNSISVPRFILLDRNGCFINANMTRPSDPETLELLLKLLND